MGFKNFINVIGKQIFNISNVSMESSWIKKPEWEPHSCPSWKYIVQCVSFPEGKVSFENICDLLYLAFATKPWMKQHKRFKLFLGNMRCIQEKQVLNISYMVWSTVSFPGGTSGKEPICQCRKRKKGGFNPWVRKIPWRRAQQPTLVLLLENPMDKGT